MPKSEMACRGEVWSVQRFLEDYSADNCRFLMKSFNISGDHPGQSTSGYRWPFGPVLIISPFNFPFKLPAV
jgi:1-pyrroline-5-carboxylate dehydrogenase